jgi:TatD DNase family protein
VTSIIAGEAPLVDTHCHVDLFQDPRAVIARAERGRAYCIAVTNTPSVFEPMERLANGSRYVRAALGFHPEVVAARKREVALLTELVPRARYIGEIGLDYVTSNQGERALQREVLSRIVELSDAHGGQVLTVHSRRAAEDVVDAFGVGFRGTWILHWYSGSLKTLRRALAHGAFVSVNPAMVRAERSALRWLREVPRERLLTETDGPFVSVGEAAAEPPAVIHALEGLARLFETEVEDMRTQVFANFRAVLEGGAGSSQVGKESV